jgi:catechol 2,3-dioxygenase-like lactoylglutathione lyase family enzyme
MQVQKLDHVNIHTANVERMVDWYGRVLGMPPGKRPPFSFPGAWLYCGDQPTVHLVGLDEQPKVSGVTLEHFAFTATGLRDFMARLKAHGVRYDARKVPGSGSVQINVWDPDGNHIHVDFSPQESAGVDVEETSMSAMPQPGQR